MGERVGHFTRELAELPIFLREKAIEFLPQHLLFGPTEETLSATTPAGNEACSIDTDNGRMGRGVDDLPKLRRRKEVSFGGRPGTC
jgi:hypothetical protein